MTKEKKCVYNAEFVKGERLAKLIDFCQKQAYVELPYRGKKLTRSPKCIFKKNENVGVYRFGQMKCGYNEGLNHFPETIEEIANQIKEEFGDDSINTAMIIKYTHGTKHHIPWHSDKQEGVKGAGAKDITADSSIYNVIVFTGATNRVFQVAKVEDIAKDGTCGEYIYNDRTANGALFMLTAEGNREYKHCVPKERKWKGERYSIVFRCIKNVDAQKL